MQQQKNAQNKNVRIKMVTLFWHFFYFDLIFNLTYYLMLYINVDCFSW